jgi:hypothetical protein
MHDLHTTSLCVLCTTMCKHSTTWLKMNASNSIFWLVHIPNLPTLFVQTPFCSPYMTYVDCAHWFIDYVNPFVDYGITFVDCTNFFVACSNKFDVCVNTLDDWANIYIDLVDTLNKLFSNFCIPNPSLLQLSLTNLLVIYRLKINTILTSRSFICSSSLVCQICGFWIS